MSANNTQIRSRATSTVRSQFGPIVLLKMAQGAVLSLLLLFSSLISAPLKAGYTHGLLELVRGKDLKVNVVFSRFRHILAAILLPTWTALKTVAWVLPGLLIAIVGLIVSATGGEDFLVAVGGIIAAVGGIMCAVWGIQAHYRYKMARIAFADNPDLDVYNAVEYSKRMMEGRKFQLFCLTFSYQLLKVLAIVAAVGVCAIGMQLEYDLFFLGVILMFAAIIAAIAAFIYLTLQKEVAEICFYDENHI